MNVQLEKIDAYNWEQCIELTVFEKQKDFVADNCYSLLQSKFADELYPLSIYNQGTIVGFLMYGVDPDTKRMEMCRLMVDKNHQGKGYGKEAVFQLLELIKNTYGGIEFYTSVEPDNVNTIRLYENVGFIKTGEIMWDEVVLKIQL